MAKDFLTHRHENAHNIIINYDFLNTSKATAEDSKSKQSSMPKPRKTKKRHLFCMHAKLCSHRSSVFHSLLIMLNYIYINRSKTMQQYSNNSNNKETHKSLKYSARLGCDSSDNQIRKFTRKNLN